MLSVEQRRDAAMRAPMGPGLLYPDTRVIARAGWYQLITASAPRGTLNEVAFSQVEPGDAERVIDETIAACRAAAQPVKWWVGPWTRPEDMGARLQRRGFVRSDVRAMGCETSRRFSPTPGLEVVEIQKERLDVFLDTQWRGWFDSGAPSEVDREVHLAALAATPRVAHLFATERGGELVGTSALLVRDGFGYLLGGQVLASARGLGAYRAMVAARLAFLAARGMGYAVTQARAGTSAPILEKLGFERLYDCCCYSLET